MEPTEPTLELFEEFAGTGTSREGNAITLIVVVDDPRRAGAARTAFAEAAGATAPNYYLAQSGDVTRMIADERAGGALGLAIYEARRRNMDRVSLSILIERPPELDYSDLQIASLHQLLAHLYVAHGLSETALATILSDPQGRLRVYPYLPPPPELESEGLPLGSARDPQQELFVQLFAESYKPCGGTMRLNQAFPLHAARFNLGAPVGLNEPPPVTLDRRNFNFQAFARDTIFNEGTEYAAVQQLSALFDPERMEIPSSGTGRRLLEASFQSALKASRTRGVPLKGRENLEPGWRFHQVARNAGYGPPLSGNYVSDDGKYAVQVFAGETLYTPMTDQAGCTYLSATEPSDPAYAVIWRETYKVAKAAYDPNSPFQQQATALKLGAPLTGVYPATLSGTAYQIQVWALDTLYRGPDGQIRRMSDLPKPAEIQNWVPKQSQPAPPTPPNPLPPAVPPSQAGAPRRGDPNWPPRPDFSILTDRNAARERALGRIEYVRANGDMVRITNGWDRDHIVDIVVPQLAKFIPGGRLKFHKAAAQQFIRLWAEWEAAGLLGFIKTYDGAWVARTIRLKPTVLSNHAYGTAFDINARWNGLMKPAALVGQEGSVRELVPIANRLGFYWGGHWNYDGKGASDGMHFEWARPA
ncbi:MAG: M15 family metallopeptidase [Oscillochloridaceae bacterium umkhey_bin13]